MIAIVSTGNAAIEHCLPAWPDPQSAASGRPKNFGQAVAFFIAKGSMAGQTIGCDDGIRLS